MKAYLCSLSAVKDGDSSLVATRPMMTSLLLHLIRDYVYITGSANPKFALYFEAAKLLVGGIYGERTRTGMYRRPSI